LPWIAHDQVLLILGAPRSGTSWTAKVFDSHPDVLYRHEPDIALNNPRSFPPVLGRDDILSHLEEARAYLRKLSDTRTVKSVGSRPMFAKSYDNVAVRLLRRAMIVSLYMAERVPFAGRFASRVPVPDMLGKVAHPTHLVMKSVSAGTSAKLFAEALPGCRVVFLVRHPCGQIASVLRGVRLGRLELHVGIDDFLRAGGQEVYGLTNELFAHLPPVEQAAWTWVLQNERILTDLADIHTACIVRHKDLVLAPQARFRELFTFAGLGWSQQTEAFIEHSTSGHANAGYYDVVRKPDEALNRWRHELSAVDRARIHAIVCDTWIGRCWPDYLE
jgi:hypothetical protein